MVTFFEAIERLKDILSQEMGNKRVFDKDVAAALGLTQANFASMKSRDAVPYREIMDFCALRGISINWLFYNQDVRALEEQTNKFCYVRFFSDIHASAGGGALNEDELASQTLELDADIAKTLGVTQAKNIDAIRVRGDSMEPLIQDGAILFVDRSDTDASKGGIFVVNTSGGVFVKRIAIKIDGSVELISENRSYAPERVSREEIVVVGRAIGQAGRMW